MINLSHNIISLQYSKFYMHSNSWNLRRPKQRLEILERTQAQKRHLINILSAKSAIDSKNKQKLKHHSLPMDILKKKNIEKNNESMIQRIIKINNGCRVSLKPKGQLSQFSRNLKTYSSLNRSIRNREIEQQNSKMFSRLITTTSTIKRENWIKRNIQTSKYKENLHRSKYRKPDYSQQACRILSQSPKFKCLNLTNFGSNSKVRIVKKSKCT